MKKVFSIITAVFLVTAFFTGCNTDKEKIKYSVLIDTESALTYAEGDSFYGLPVDILNAIADEEDMEISYVDNIGKDTYQVSISTLTDGSDSYDYTDHFYQQGIVLATRSDSEIKTYEDLLHKTVGALENSYGLDFACQISPQYNITVKDYKSDVDLYNDLKDGKIDALFDDELAVAKAIKDGDKIKAFSNSEKTNLLSFAVNKGENQEFINRFNDGYKKIVENGTYEDIIKKYK